MIPHLHVLAHELGGYPRVPGARFPSDVDDSKKKRRVLIVDDEELIAHSLTDILRWAGFDARFALSGLEAVSMVEQFCPDIVISDVIMPELDGVQTAVRIRGLCPDARIVLFSGQAATSDILDRARSEGHHFDLLPKPIHPARLIEAVHKLI